jgi:hypothetical protein
VTLLLSIPAEGQVFGPGYDLAVSTDLIGPFDTSAQFILQIHRLQPEEPAYELHLPYSHFQNSIYTLWATMFPTATVTQLNTVLPFNQSLLMRLEFQDLFTGAQDGPTDFMGRFWDPYGGVGRLTFLNASTGSGTGGFTDADRAELGAIAHATSLPTYSNLISHSGLTGAQAITLSSGARAVSWTVTVLPPNASFDPGLPNYYFNLGFVTPIVQGRYIRSTRVVFTPQLLALPEACHEVAVDLEPGVVVELLELASP